MPVIVPTKRCVIFFIVLLTTLKDSSNADTKLYFLLLGVLCFFYSFKYLKHIAAVIPLIVR